MQVVFNSRYFKVFAFISVLTALTLFAASSDSFAITSKTKLTRPSSTSAFCTSLNTKANGVTAKIDSLSENLIQAQNQQSKNKITQYQEVDKKVDANRGLADANRSDNFTKLEARATNDNEKIAVQTYKTAVDVAVSARRLAYDNARKEFRSGIQSSIDNRKSTVSSRVDTYKNSVNTAISNAKASCLTSSTESSTIRTTFQSAMKTAQTTYRNNRSSDDKVKTEADSLATMRNATFESANQAFKDSMSVARKNLILAFGSKTNI